ncbi:MAG TPA: zinc ABC transporter substrate-binding protein [Candidatus Dormibacteraeota bacterium]|nr:zinc ABC transporter substrate-binding protein [Candidatus Dormibacteraeota bacterium]
MRSIWVGVAVIVALSGCGLSSTSQASGGRVEVVAAENFWGSVAAQVGGDRVDVTSIIANPATDPHDYDPTANDARLIAGAGYFIVNGAGYDPWASKLAAANPVSGRRVLDVSVLAGVRDGGNPHVWYSPDIVGQVVDRITADLKRLDAGDAAYFDQRGSDYRTAGLKDYHDTIGAIKQRYAGTPVGASESIFAYMAPAVGLDLVTPSGYLQAISEGTDPSAADKATVDRQITTRQVKVFVFNSQNSTPEVQSAVDKARAAGIPVVQITETLSPPGATFQDWQTKQLKALLAALGG